jgi:hypothetical protein
MAKKPDKTKPKLKPKRPPIKHQEATEATAEDFEREGMGIASKE